MFDPRSPYHRRMWHYESDRPLSVAQLVALGSLDARTAALLWLLIERHQSLIVSGPTDPTPGVGKTTTLNALLGFLPTGTTLVYTMGMYEDFEFRNEVEPTTTRVLANEVSNHLAIYNAAASAAGRTLNPDVAADLPQDIADLYGVTAEGGSPLPQVSSLEPEIERPEAASPWHAPTPDVSEFDTGELMIPTASDKPEPPIVPVTTLEALELNFATSGFQHIELRPGELETLVDQTPTDKQTAQPRPVEAQSTLPEPPITEWQVSTAASVEHPTGQANGHTTAAPLADAPVPAVPVTTPASSAPMPARSAEPEPAHDDYPARLDLARRRRDAGRLDDALTEYRVILRNAPDLLADVIGDLNKLMEDAPEHPEVHRLLGDARIRQGDYLSALESYNRAVSLTQARSE